MTPCSHCDGAADVLQLHAMLERALVAAEAMAVQRDALAQRVAELATDLAVQKEYTASSRAQADLMLHAYSRLGDRVAELEAALAKIAEMPHSNPTGDTLHGPCPKCIAQDALEKKR